MFVFLVREAVYIDLLGVAHLDPYQGKIVNCWTSLVSDIKGCEQWVRPHTAAPQVSLADAIIPVWCLRDALQADGWLPVRRSNVCVRASLQALWMTTLVWDKGNASGRTASAAREIA